MSELTVTTALAPYFKDTGFILWMTNKGYNQYTTDTIQKYYSRYQHHVMCTQRRCHDCAGSFPSWSTEQDIITGNIRHERCVHKQQLEQQRAGKEYAQRLEVPPAYKDVTLESISALPLDSKKIIENFVSTYPANVPQGLYLYAEKHGSGRTSILWWIVKTLADAGKLPRGILLKTTPNLLLSFLQESIEHPLITYAKYCDILLLDDWGQEKQTEWSRTAFEAIFEERNWNRRPIIISSILPCAEWAWPDGPDQSLISKIKRSCVQVNVDEDGGNPL